MVTLLWSNVAHISDHQVIGAKSQLLSSRRALPTARPEKAHVNWRKEGDKPIPHCQRLWVAGCDSFTSDQYRVGQSPNQWHHGSPNKHRRTGIEQLPYDRNSLQPGGDRSVRIDQTTHQHEIDP
jgi:hypothetical protein